MRIPFRLLSIVCFIILTFNTNLSFAQIKFGPKTGLNFTILPNNAKYIIGNRQIYNGYHLGIIAEFRLYEQLFLQPGVLISTKGSKYVVGNNTVGSTTGFSEFQFSTYNADIPVNLVYKFDLDYFKILLITGPYLGYGLTGKWTGSDGTSAKVHFGNDSENDLKPFDYGLNFGVGFEAIGIQLSSQYYLGLTSLSTLTLPLKEQKYKALTISIAYLFGKDINVRRDYKNTYLRRQRQNKVHMKR